MLPEIQRELENLGYTLGESLRPGGFGIVFLATHHQVGCVVKISLKPIDDLPQLQKEYDRLELLKTLMPHERLVELRGVLRLPENGRLHLVTVWHRASKNLGQRMRDEEFAFCGESERVRRLLGYIEDAAHGLAYLHGHGIVHRDIKPDNLFFYATDQHVRLGDLGAAKLVGLSAPEEPGTVTGTVPYMPPEQYDGDAFPASDIYSLAATYVTLRTGHTPWRLQHDEHTRPNLRGMKAEEAAIVGAALLTDHRQRPTDVLEWVQKLRNAALGGVESPKSPAHDDAVKIRDSLQTLKPTDNDQLATTVVHWRNEAKKKAEVLKALVICARHGEPLVRATAIAALANQSEVPEVLAALLECTTSHDPMVRAAAVSALDGQLDRAEVLQSVLARLDDSNPNVRAAAYTATAETDRQSTTLKDHLEELAREHPAANDITPRNVLSRLEKLQPHSILDRIMFMINHPPQDRPAIYLTHSARSLAVVEWAQENETRWQNLIRELQK